MENLLNILSNVAMALISLAFGIFFALPILMGQATILGAFVFGMLALGFLMITGISVARCFDTTEITLVAPVTA